MYTKIYQHFCFENKGGLILAIGWDGTDDWNAFYRMESSKLYWNNNISPLIHRFSNGAMKSNF
jgi:hypothetical protein